MKPQNIGFTADKKLKLFDFGLAVCVKKNRTHDTTYRMTGNTGSLAYMAPEVALRKPYNEKVDVYSFAILLWQMLSGMELYLDVACANFVDQVVLGGQRPPLPAIAARAPVGVAKLIERCWHADHTTRPDFTTILRTLTDFTEESCSVSATAEEEEKKPMPLGKNSKLSIKNMFLPKVSVVPAIDEGNGNDSSDLSQCMASKIKEKKPSSSSSSTSTSKARHCMEVTFPSLKW